MVKDMLAAEVIEETSSPWASPVVMIKAFDSVWIVTD